MGARGTPASGISCCTGSATVHIHSLQCISALEMDSGPVGVCAHRAAARTAPAPPRLAPPPPCRSAPPAPASAAPSSAAFAPTDAARLSYSTYLALGAWVLTLLTYVHPASDAVLVIVFAAGKCHWQQRLRCRSGPGASLLALLPGASLAVASAMHPGSGASRDQGRTARTPPRRPA